MTSEWFNDLKKSYTEIITVIPELHDGETLKGTFKGIVTNEEENRQYYVFVYDGKIYLYIVKEVCWEIEFQVNFEYSFRYIKNEYRI